VVDLPLSTWWVCQGTCGTQAEVSWTHHAELAARGPMPDPVVASIRDRFAAIGAAWPARI
jgi:hypothetical protein